MREILFRGKRICGNKEWVEGCLLNLDEDSSHVFIVPFFHSASTIPICRLVEYTSVYVNPETVGQFTGKTDKNGKKVFEHDILQTFTIWADGTVEKGGICVVQWREHDQCYVLATKEGYHIDDFGNLGRPEYYEVIGNIHDNPELLKGE